MTVLTPCSWGQFFPIFWVYFSKKSWSRPKSVLVIKASFPLWRQ